MKNFVYALLADGVQYATVRGTPSDVQKEFVKADQRVYINSKITKKKLGVCVGNRVIYFKDLTFNSEKELSTLSDHSLNCLIKGDLDNDNITFFLEERGLIFRTIGANNATAKGQELINAYLK